MVRWRIEFYFFGVKLVQWPPPIISGLILMGLEYSEQLIARGVIIILAVNVVRSRK